MTKKLRNTPQNFILCYLLNLAALHPLDDPEPFFKNRKCFGAVQWLNIFRCGLRRTFFFFLKWHPRTLEHLKKSKNVFFWQSNTYIQSFFKNRFFSFLGSQNMFICQNIKNQNFTYHNGSSMRNQNIENYSKYKISSFPYLFLWGTFFCTLSCISIMQYVNIFEIWM